MVQRHEHRAQIAHALDLSRVRRAPRAWHTAHARARAQGTASSGRLLRIERWAGAGRRSLRRAHASVAPHRRSLPTEWP